MFEINGSGSTPDLVYTNVRTSEQQRFKMRIIFCKKDARHNEIKRDSPYVHLNSVLVKNTFALFDSYVTKITFLPCAFYLALESLCNLKQFGTTKEDKLLGIHIRCIDQTFLW